MTKSEVKIEINNQKTFKPTFDDEPQISYSLRQKILGFIESMEVNCDGYRMAMDSSKAYIEILESRIAYLEGLVVRVARDSKEL